MIAGLLLTHIPIHPSDMGRFRANIHGHIHGHPSPAPVHTVVEGTTIVRPYINVCVEWLPKFQPVSFEELDAQIKRFQQKAQP